MCLTPFRGLERGSVCMLCQCRGPTVQRIRCTRPLGEECGLELTPDYIERVGEVFRHRVFERFFAEETSREESLAGVHRAL